MGLQVRFTELQRVTNPLMRWILHTDQVMSSGVMHKNLEILYMSQGSCLLSAVFCTFQKRHGVGFGCRGRNRASVLPGMSRTLYY